MNSFLSVLEMHLCVVPVCSGAHVWAGACMWIGACMWTGVHVWTDVHKGHLTPLSVILRCHLPLLRQGLSDPQAFACFCLPKADITPHSCITNLFFFFNVGSQVLAKKVLLIKPLPKPHFYLYKSYPVQLRIFVKYFRIDLSVSLTGELDLFIQFGDHRNIGKQYCDQDNGQFLIHS